MVSPAFHEKLAFCRHTFSFTTFASLLLACGTNAASGSLVETSDVTSDDATADAPADALHDGATDSQLEVRDWVAEAQEMETAFREAARREDDCGWYWVGLQTANYIEARCACEFPEDAARCYVQSVEARRITVEALSCALNTPLPLGQRRDCFLRATHVDYMSCYALEYRVEDTCDPNELYAAGHACETSCSNPDCTPYDATAWPFAVAAQCGLDLVFPPPILGAP